MKQEAILKRIMEGIERLSPSAAKLPDFVHQHSFVWKTLPERLEVVANTRALDPKFLIGS